MASKIVLSILVLATAVSCLSNADLFFLSDAKLFQMGIDQFRNGINSNQLGRCAISNDPHACSHYAKVCDGNGACQGLPDLYGSGCLQGCWGPPNTYENYQNTRLPICTNSVVTNGANMLRIGLLKGYCGIQNASIATSSSAASRPATCLSDAELFFLPDAELFAMGVYQFRVGGVHSNQLDSCFINDDPHACSNYAQMCGTNRTCYGLPDLIGSGCLDSCWGPPNTYYNYESSKIPVCTGNVTINGANMLRIGIVKGYCKSQNYSPKICSRNGNYTNVSSSASNASDNGSPENHPKEEQAKVTPIKNSTSSNISVSDYNSSSPHLQVTVTVKTQTETNEKMVVWSYWVGWVLAFIFLGSTVVLVLLLIREIKKRQTRQVINRIYQDSTKHFESPSINNSSS